ncbi:beta-galactosidase [Bremerella cremea]|uniref:beta-galactosidase n=1 Tax=Bremerella cremea TaxID=1031537 RepID=UPI0013144E16|nr:beta-galactosidase [Bremerella cremea]
MLEVLESDGVKIKVPYRTATRTPILLSTCSLRIDNKAPYDLLLELARGTLFRFRTLCNACLDADLDLLDLTLALLRDATDNFARAAVTKDHPEDADKLALKSLGDALEGISQLEHVYSAASHLAIKKQGQQRAFLRGMALNEPMSPDIKSLLTAPLNAALVEPNWKHCEPEIGHHDWQQVDQTLESIRQEGLSTILGPLFSLDRFTTPDWLYLWENDFAELLNAVQRYAVELVQHFRNRVDLWYCAAGLNDQTAVAMKEEQRLQLLIHIIHSLRSTGLRAPLLVSFAKPWGEYMTSRDRELAPIHFAEELVRARVGITGIGLEFNFGEHTPATYYRGYFDVEDLLDYWSLLGVPLFVTLSAPSSWRPDPEAIYDANRQEEPLERISRRTQRELVEHILPAILTHPQVQGVFWTQVSDAQPHRFPHAGLLDPRGRPKSSVTKMTEIIRTYFPENI